MGIPTLLYHGDTIGFEERSPRWHGSFLEGPKGMVVACMLWKYWDLKDLNDHGLALVSECR